jgi:2-keto-4-pentenoate hydratase
LDGSVFRKKPKLRCWRGKVSLSKEEMANALWEAYKGEAIAPLRDVSDDVSPEMAYQIQNIITERRLSEGARLVGRKIGLTSKAVQKQLGVDQPDYGMLFAESAYCSGDTIQATDFLQPKAEAEIAFVLKKDLHHKNISIVDVLSAIDYAVAAIEIVDSRIQNWDISLFDTIADNASYGAFVLGTRTVPLKDLDLESCRMTLTEDGKVVSEGLGSACLGNPLNATLWLARVMSASGRPLSSGDVVMSGALGPMQAMQAGCRYEASVDGLGKVSINVAEDA